MEFLTSLPDVSRQPGDAARNRRVAEECRKNPNKYTCLREYDGKSSAAYTYAQYVNKGVIKSLGGLRASVRTVGGVSRVYVAHITDSPEGT